jgi:hypothetical protein
MPDSNSKLPLSPRDKLLRSHSSLLRWLELPEGLLFNDWVLDLLRQAEKKLHREKEYVEVFRAQGASEVLNAILDVEKDLRQYSKDLQEKKVEPIKEA